MNEFNSSVPFTMTIIILLFILAIFAMKYGAQYLRDRTLAAKSNDTDQRINALREKSDKLEKRVAHMEALLKEVE